MDIFHSTECGICKKKIVNAELKSHMKDTHEEEPCIHCGEKFTTKEEVAKHIRNEHLVMTSRAIAVRDKKMAGRKRGKLTAAKRLTKD